MKRSLLTLGTLATVLSLSIAPAFAAKAPAAKPTVDTACMATAVSARDTSIATALQTVVTGIQTRGQALAAAWGNTDPTARKTAVKAANTAFAGTWKTFNTARKTAWSTYAASAKKCRAAPAEVATPSNEAGSL